MERMPKRHHSLLLLAYKGFHNSGTINKNYIPIDLEVLGREENIWELFLFFFLIEDLENNLTEGVKRKLKRTCQKVLLFYSHIRKSDGQW